MIRMLVYTHSDYDTVFNLWYRQNKKYFPSSNVYLMSDVLFEEEVTKNITYDDSKKYTDRVLSCLDKFNDDEVVIFQHEDMLLYSEPLYDVLNTYVELISSDSVAMIRLLRVVPTLEPSGIHNMLYLNPPTNLFSIQPTIIKIKTLKQIFSMVPNKTIWEAETYWEKNLEGYVSVFSWDGEPKRGMMHYDSRVYPYIATAINKGQWNMTEYSAELINLFNEYGLRCY